MRLLASNLDEFRSVIPWEKLPKTFQDAISVTEKLGTRFFWIDALCIVQDSAEDWAYEAARMTAVYTNSSLNISADASSNAHQGLFRERDETSVVPFCLPMTSHESCDKYVFYVDEWPRAIDSSPLSERGWVVQEVSEYHGVPHLMASGYFADARFRVSAT